MSLDLVLAITGARSSPWSQQGGKVPTGLGPKWASWPCCSASTAKAGTQALWLERMGWYLLVSRDIPEVPVLLTGFAQMGGDMLGTAGMTPLASPVLQTSSRKAAPAHGMPRAA